MQNVQKDIEREKRLLSHCNLQSLVLFLEAIVGSFRDNLYIQIFVYFLSSFLFTQIIVYHSKKAKCKRVSISIYALSRYGNHVCLLCGLVIHLPVIFNSCMVFVSVDNVFN